MSGKSCRNQLERGWLRPDDNSGGVGNIDILEVEPTVFHMRLDIESWEKKGLQ